MAKAQTAQEFDRRFDEGEDVFDLAEIKPEDITRPGLSESKRINIDLPGDFLVELDREAARRGITRQSLIKVWLYERLHNDQGVTIIEAENGKIVFPNRLRDSVIQILKATKGAMKVEEIVSALQDSLTNSPRAKAPKSSPGKTSRASKL